jgi:hypothetical protein
MMQSQIFLAAQEPFLTAELHYRRERLERDYRKHGRRVAASRRRWVPRRPALHQPRPRRRPVAIA